VTMSGGAAREKTREVRLSDIRKVRLYGNGERGKKGTKKRARFERKAERETLYFEKGRASRLKNLKREKTMWGMLHRRTQTKMGMGEVPIMIQLIHQMVRRCEETWMTGTVVRSHGCCQLRIVINCLNQE